MNKPGDGACWIRDCIRDDRSTKGDQYATREMDFVFRVLEESGGANSSGVMVIGVGNENGVIDNITDVVTDKTMEVVSTQNFSETAVAAAEYWLPVAAL
ncbi:hypothetical protein Tco_0445940 [Tanacetum coccineum]